jgi:hypothetical protein
MARFIGTVGSSADVCVQLTHARSLCAGASATFDWHVNDSDYVKVKAELDAAVTAGTLTYKQSDVPPSYTTLLRPSATLFDAGTMIWNTTTAIPNFSTGTIWVNAAGTTV